MGAVVKRKQTAEVVLLLEKDVLEGRRNQRLEMGSKAKDW